jgi:hypothetical protein
VIDWLSVFYNGLWILGCALILAALSYTSWLAQAQGERLRPLLDAFVFQFPFSIGMGLISLGAFFLARGWLEHLLWAIFVILFLWQSGDVALKHRRDLG